MSKVYLTAQGLLEDSFALAKQVLDSGFKPTFIIAIWRGGVPIGIAVQEYLEYPLITLLFVLLLIVVLIMRLVK